MEELLFTWKSWDVVEEFIYQFYDVTLTVPIGKHAIGTVFEYAVIDYFAARLTLARNGKSECFKLQLSVV
jgi:hypothetical protein